jgi:outer membrane murein-binding lipoprotein Lpp
MFRKVIISLVLAVSVLLSGCPEKQPVAVDATVDDIASPDVTLTSDVSTTPDESH